MYKPSIRMVGLLVLAFAWTLAPAISPAVLNAPARDDAGNTSDQSWSVAAPEVKPGEGGQDALTWANKAVIPTEGVSRTAGVWAPDGKFHLICGNCQTHTSHPWDQVYDPVADAWTQGLNHPAGTYGVHNHDACIIGDTIYCGGGSSYTGYYDNLTALAVAESTWTVVTAMPAASMLYYSFAVCNGKVYCFGGTTDQTNCLSTVYEFDPASGVWNPGTAMPDVRRNPICATWGDTIYVIGGFATVAAYTGTTTMWKYCPSTDQWTTGTAFSAGTGWGRGVVYTDAVLGPIVCVIGGYNSAGAVVNTVSTYAITTGVWGTETPEIGGRRSQAAAVSSDGILFVAGGYNGAILATTEMATAFTGIEEPRPADGLASSLVSVGPNPVKGSALVSYSLARPGHAGLYLYNVSGRQVARLYEGQVMAGTHRLSISTTGLARGIYVIKVRTSDATANTKLVVE